jgi:hypothetical protein
VAGHSLARRDRRGKEPRFGSQESGDCTILFDNVRSIMFAVLVEGDKSTVGALGRYSRGFGEGDSGDTDIVR